MWQTKIRESFDALLTALENDELHTGRYGSVSTVEQNQAGDCLL
jgi:hypothetical protein